MTENDIDYGDGAEIVAASEQQQQQQQNNNLTEQQQQQQPVSQVQSPKEIFGEDYDDWDKVKSAWQENRVKANEVESLRQAKAELEARLGDTSVFADDEVLGFNNFVKTTGTKDYDLFHKIKTHDSTKDPIETLVLKEVLDNPGLKGKEELVKKRIMKHYEVDPDNFSPEEIELGQLNVQKAAEVAAKSISEIKEKLAEKPVSGYQKHDPEKVLGEWSEAVQQELDSVTSLEIPVKRGDKVEKYIDFQLTPEIKSKYKDGLAQVFSRAGAVTPEVRKSVTDVFQARFIKENLGEIIHSVLEKNTQDLRMEYDKEYNGFRSEKPPGGGNTNQGADDDYSDLFD